MIRNMPLNAVMIIILLAANAYATGVAMPYWDSNPLYMAKGESQQINIELQNMVGDNEATFQLSLQSTNNIASFADKDLYTLKAGERIQVPIEIEIPSTALEGEKYKVTLVAQESKSSPSGSFTLGSAFENSFEVIVGQPKPSTSTSALGDLFDSANKTIYLIIAVVALALIILWFKIRSKSSR